MERKAEYDWSLPYRINHWLHVASILILTVTGFYIHWPFASGGEGDAFLMASMRFAHFFWAYVLVLGLVWRLYMAFNSKFLADWRSFSPIKNLLGVPKIAKYYLLLTEEHDDYGRYNPLQALTYLFWAFLIVFMALTGFALYRGSVFGLPAPASFLWVRDLLGGEANTRIAHYLGMWVFILTTLVHVYMAIMVQGVQRDNSLLCMFTGYRLKKVDKVKAP